MRDHALREQYLDLLKRALANTIYGDANVAPWRFAGYDEQARADGVDWPSAAHTMIGRKRLDNVQFCVQTVLDEGVPGDLIETGVWRGGAAILMRGVLAANEVTDRVVWLADSFEGLPPPDPERYPADTGDTHHTVEFLAVPSETVRQNFRRYDLLDDQVRFLEGWFRDTLPTAPIEQLAVLRLDGDMYESTWDALTGLYPKLAPGGFLIVDDYHAVEGCRRAVHDYRAAQGITDRIHDIDGSGVYWRTGGPSSTPAPAGNSTTTHHRPVEPAGGAAAGTPAPHSETRSALDDLIAAAGGGRLDSVIDEIGAEHVTRLVIAELRCRTVPRASAPVEIALVLEHRTESWATRIRIDPAGRFETFHSAGPVDDADVTVTQSLAEVAGNLFGPRGTTTSATRSITWRDTGAVFGTALPMFDTVRRVLDSIDRPYSPGLSELCTAAGSDKWGLHQYTRHYEHHFEAIRDRPLTVLEIGVGGYSDPRQGGGSLRMWRNYFCRATVYGMDIVDKTALSEQRMTVLRGDQSAPTDLAGVAAITGPLDIVIDDGSHIGSHIITSFHTLFPVLRAGGWYVIEDLQTAYWPSFAEGPGSPTAMDFVTGLIDGLNHAEIGGRTPCDTDTQVKGLHFYHNMVFIEKGTNRDSGAPPWVRTR